MTFGLTQKQRHALNDCFAHLACVERVWIYGSRATGRHRPNSDIDLVLEGDLDWKDMAHVRA